MRIEVLKELANVLNEKGLQKHKTLNNLASESGLLLQLFKGLKENNFSNDEEAKAFLYQDYKKEDSKYRTLKFRLQNILLNSLSVEKRHNTINHHNDAINECYSNLFIIKILLKDDARKSVLELANKTLVISEKFEITEVSLSLSHILKQDAFLNGHQKLFEFYHDKTEKLLSTLNAELLSEHYLDNIRLVINSTAYRSSTFKNEIQESYNLLREKYPKVSSFYYKLNLLLLKILDHHFSSQYQKALATTNSALQLLKSNPLLYRETSHQEFLINKLQALYSLKSYNEAKVLALKDQKILKPRTKGWFILRENQFLISIQREEFSETEQILKEVYSGNLLKKEPQYRIEKWRIFHAYFNWMIRIGWVNKTNLDPPGLNFKYYKFLNELSFISNDKKGFNIAIQIFQNLHYIANHDFCKVSERTEPLQSYVKRHLTDSQNRRSKLFIKMLIILEKQEFDYKKAYKKALPAFKELRESNFIIENIYNIGPEIIPFDKLWIKILKFLKET